MSQPGGRLPLLLAYFGAQLAFYSNITAFSGFLGILRDGLAKSGSKKSAINVDTLGNTIYNINQV